MTSIDTDKEDSEKEARSRHEEHVNFVRQWVAEELRVRGRAPRYFIQTFGCQQNDHDSEIAAGILEEMGLAPSKEIDGSDLVLFNTCSVRANADDRFFGNVGRLKSLRKNTRPVIGVFGCMMEQKIHAETIKSTFPFVDFILGAGAMTSIPMALARIVASSGHLGKKRATLDLTAASSPSDSITEENLPVRRRDRHRALITIMTGCNNFCTYCIVPYTRGREKSRRRADIVSEAKRAVSQGAREIMLLGQNVNSYGASERNCNSKDPEFPTFAALLEEIARIDGLFVLRYMTSHPKDLSDDLIEVIGRCPVVESHIHLPLQSGSDRILKKMNRHYDSAHFQSLVKKLRIARPDITITTDLMVGFPGETEEDFEATLRVMSEVRFDAAFTFIYSPREGTPAAGWSVDDGETIAMADDALVHARFERLAELQNRLSVESNAATEGKDVEVLVDGSSRRSPYVFSGRTHNNRLVNFSIHDMTTVSDDTCDFFLNTHGAVPGAGDIVRVRVDRAKTFSLEGTMLEVIRRQGVESL